MVADEVKPFTLHLTAWKNSDGKVVLELRKRLILGPKNEKFIKDLVKASFSDKPIKASVIIAYQDKLMAKCNALKYGLLED